MKKQLYQKAFVQYGNAKPKETFLTVQTVEELEKPATEAGKKAARERMNITKIEPEYYELSETTGNDGNPATEFIVTKETPESVAETAPAKKTAAAKTTEPAAAKRGPKPAAAKTTEPATTKNAENTPPAE